MRPNSSRPLLTATPPPAPDAASADVPLGSVEELLVDFLAQRPEPSDADFDSLCAAHREHAQELRRLFTEWRSLDRMLGGVQEPALGAAPASRSSGGSKIEDVQARMRERGTTHTRFERLREIARGGMGVVFEAWDPDLRRSVAMKMLRRDKHRLERLDTPQRDRIVARFLEEAQITGQLEHPGVVPVHELGIDAEGTVFFTMSLVRGMELTQVIELARAQRDGWSMAKALGVLLKVCEAVAYAHSKGVVHRDLKPSNVMVGRFGETYVMDWGLARVVGSSARERDGDVGIETDLREELASTPQSPLRTRNGAVIGTPAYMSPEQAFGRTESIGPRTDVYAIGAMLYHLLTGQMPYVPSGSKATPQSVLVARLLGPPSPVLEVAPQAPPELAAICERAMHLDPDRRYATASELAADIERFLDRRPVGAYASSFTYALRLALVRNKRLAALLATLALCVVAFSVRDSLQTRAAWRREEGLREVAEAGRARQQRLADVAGAAQCIAAADELYPAVPERAPDMRAWLERAEELVSRRPLYERELLAALVPSDTREHLANLMRISGLCVEMRARAQAAETLVERTLDARAQAWTRAIDSIASSAAYGGLRITPQRGLIPLQANPRSGLWEFWVDGTGLEPRLRDARTGELELDPESALVLVLLPGGVLELGADATQRQRENEPRRSVALAPFFLGRTEVPQSAWMRTMGDNPSQCRDDDTTPYDPWCALLPVEYVDWTASARFARRLDLSLPSEAQWEFAASAGGGESYQFGASDDERCLDGRENVYRLAFASGGWRDGYALTAPIASYTANALGLHDMLGNVSEWCSDLYSAVPFDGTPRTESEGPYELRSIRGGSYYTPTSESYRPSFRQYDRPQGANQTRGLRVARDLRP